MMTRVCAPSRSHLRLRLAGPGRPVSASKDAELLVLRLFAHLLLFQSGLRSQVGGESVSGKRMAVGLEGVPCCACGHQQVRSVGRLCRMTRHRVRRRAGAG
jgi:hypothetical protein